MKSERDTAMDPAGNPQPDALEVLAMKHTFRLTAGGLIGALAAFVFALLILRNSPDEAKLLPTVLGALFTFIGTILGHLQGSATGRAEASKARKEAEALRTLVRMYEQALPVDTEKVRQANPDVL
jgi:hypothetical protein